jgi:hypothetical protein
MLRLKYWFLNYVYDLVTFVSAIFLFLSLTLGYWLPNLAKAMGGLYLFHRAIKINYLFP